MSALAQAIDAVHGSGGVFNAIGQVRFASPWLLLVFVALIPMAFFMFRNAQRVPRMSTSVAAEFGKLPTTNRQLTAGLLPWIWILAFVLSVFALARPQLPGRPAPLDAEGIDIALVLDVSTSMNAADFQPKDRMHVAKETMADFISQRDSDRIALVVFAGEAFTQVPLTLDYDLLHTVLASVRTGVIRDGTAIGDALATGLNRVRGGRAKSKVAIIVTDGENNAGSVPPVEAAQMAHEIGVKVFTILVGKGGRVPFPVGPDLFGQMRYRETEIPTNPELLKEIAKTTDGRFYQATDREALRGSFQDILSQMDKTRLEDAARVARHVELASLFLWPAICVLALAVVLAETRFRRCP